jgi:hypothetical protein
MRKNRFDDLADDSVIGSLIERRPGIVFWRRAACILPRLVDYLVEGI